MDKWPDDIRVRYRKEADSRREAGDLLRVDKKMKHKKEKLILRRISPEQPIKHLLVIIVVIMIEFESRSQND